MKALRAALDPVRKQNTVIDLTIEGGPAARKLHALVKDYQIDALRRDITHVDLLAIDPDKEVRADVPLEFIGKPKGAIDGGQIRTILRALEVRAKPSDIPIKLVVDVSPLGIGDVIHVSAIALPANVTTMTGRDLAVVTCAKPEEEKIEVVATPVEGAAAAAPAAGAAAGRQPALRQGGGGRGAKARRPAWPRPRRRPRLLLAARSPLRQEEVSSMWRRCGWSWGWEIPARSTNATATTSAFTSSTSSPQARACRRGRRQ